MLWYASTRHIRKAPEYSKTSSVLFTVIKLKISEVIPSCKFQGFFLFEEVRNSQGFSVFEFSPYTEI